MGKKKKRSKFNRMVVLRFALLLAIVCGSLFLLTLRGPSPESAHLRASVRAEWKDIRLAMPPALHRIPFFPYEEPRLRQDEPALPAVPPPSVAPRPGLARIAILIDDMGLNAAQSLRAMTLPAPVSLSFLPYAPHGQALVDQARAAGHEILLHMPMQPLSALSAGPGALRVDMQPEALRTVLDDNLGRLSGYDGVNNHMGSRLTADAKAMRLVLADLKEKGLFFLDSRTTPQSQGASLAAEMGLPWAARDIFLDDDQEPDAIRAQLDRVLQVARAKGQAIAIGHPHPETLDVLLGWIAALPRDRYVLVPVRALLHR